MRKRTVGECPICKSLIEYYEDDVKIDGDKFSSDVSYSITSGYYHSDYMRPECRELINKIKEEQIAHFKMTSDNFFKQFIGGLCQRINVSDI
jgi:hypothetical protein